MAQQHLGERRERKLRIPVALDEQLDARAAREGHRNVNAWLNEVIARELQTPPGQEELPLNAA